MVEIFEESENGDRIDGIDIADAMNGCCDPFPGDVMLDILSRLPVKSLMRFRCISKTFRNLTLSPAFVSMHLSRSIATVNKNYSFLWMRPSEQEEKTMVSVFRGDATVVDIPVEFAGTMLGSFVGSSRTRKRMRGSIVGSSNGLICMGFGLHKEKLVLWNPATREFRGIPAPKLDSYDIYSGFANIFYGFSYVPKSEDYKVVRFLLYLKPGCLFDEQIVEMGEVFTLSTNSWRQLNEVNLPESDVIFGRNCVLVAGTMHWIGVRTPGGFNTEDAPRDLVVAFDMGAEKFREIPMPSSTTNDDFPTLKSNDPYFMRELLAFKETTIALLDFYESRTLRGDQRCINVWVLNDYGGVNESWTKQFRIEALSVSLGCMPPYPVRFWKMENSELLMIASYEDHSEFFLYDAHTREVKSCPVSAATMPLIVAFELFPYMESLVSIK